MKVFSLLACSGRIGNSVSVACVFQMGYSWPDSKGLPGKCFFWTPKAGCATKGQTILAMRRDGPQRIVIDPVNAITISRCVCFALWSLS